MDKDLVGLLESLENEADSPWDHAPEWMRGDDSHAWGSGVAHAVRTLKKHFGMEDD